MNNSELKEKSLNYEIMASDCFIYVLADCHERAIEIAQKADPYAEIIASRKIRENYQDLHYVVINENILGYQLGDSNKAGVLGSKDNSVANDLGPILTTGQKIRPAYFYDFHNYGVTPRSAYLIYSPNEAAISDGAGFWNNELGFTDLENAQVFSQDEVDTQSLPKSTGGDAQFVLVETFLPEETTKIKEKNDVL